MAAIAKTRAANNINRSAGDIITDGYGNVGNRHRNTAAVSARGQNANVGRDHETGVNAFNYSGNLVGNHGISARGQNANVGRDHETGVNATGYSGNLVGNHGISARGQSANVDRNHESGVSAAGYNFGR